MNKSDIVRRRLSTQYLAGARARSARAVVETLGAVQAQEYQDAKWALAQRTQGLRDIDVEAELSEGSILRTHILRPTWHFVSASDLRWMLALSGPRVHAANAHPYRRLELDDKVFRRSNAVIAKVLAGGQHLTRAELREVLESAGIDTKLDNRLAYIVMRAELDGLICSGARRGKQFTYALLDERVPAAAAIERDEALLRLALRYFATRGPASTHDFAWWSGLTIADVKRAIDIAGAKLRSVTIDDKKYWFDAEQGTPPKLPPSAHLLPPYDEYFIGLKDRSALRDSTAVANLTADADVLMAHLVVSNGLIVGGWRRSIEPGRVVVQIQLLKKVTAAAEKRITAEARRFAAFLDRPLQADLY
jgi:hypothetical protein